MGRPVRPPAPPLALRPRAQRTFECLATSPVGRLLAVGSGSYDGILAPDFSVRLWGLDDGPPGLPLAGHEAPVTSLAFDPDGARLASGARDGAVIVWDARSRQEVWRVQTDKTPVRSVLFLDQGARLLVGSLGGLVAVYDLKSTAPIRSRHLEGGVSQLAAAPGEGFAVVGGARGDLLTLDLRSLNTAREQAKAHVGEVRGVALSRDGSLLATGGDDRRVVVRDPRTSRNGSRSRRSTARFIAWPSARTEAAWRSLGLSSGSPSGTSTGCGPGWPRSASPGGPTSHLLSGSHRPGRPPKSRRRRPR